MFQNRAEALALALPAAIFAAAVFLVPVMILLSDGFRNAGGGWTISAYVDFFSSPLNQAVFLRTLKLGALVTVASAVIGYAAAFAIVNLQPGMKGKVTGLVVLPLMISPAARVLGANWFQVFWKVILPLTKEGLVIGGTLVFTGCLTAYITPAILGGSKVLMLETLMYQQVSVSNNFVAASVIAFILIVMSFAANILLKRVATARNKQRRTA